VSKKLGHHKLAALKAKAAKCLIDPNEPRADMGPAFWPSEAEMLRRLEQKQERVWSSTANRPDIGPHLHGGGNGRVSHKRNEY
jgi:hypothetical protein